MLIESVIRSSYILRKPQNFAKSPSYFCPMQCQSKVRRRFHKILCASQNRELYINEQKHLFEVQKTEVKKCNIVMSEFKTFFSFFLFKKVSNFKMILSIVLLLGGRVGCLLRFAQKRRFICKVQGYRPVHVTILTLSRYPNIIQTLFI